MLSGTILVAVVDPHVRRTIQDALVAEGHCVIEAVDRNDALQRLPDERPDIVFIDFESEQESCLDLCPEMRRVSDVPIFVFAAQHCERDKVNALDAGADDYIVNPLAMQEFLARIRAVLRRKSAQGEHPIFVSNDLTIDFEQGTVCVAGTVMRLPPKEHELFQLLVVNQSKPVKHLDSFKQCGDYSGEFNLSIVECSSVSSERKLKLTLDTQSPFAQIHGSATILRPHGRSDLQLSNAEG